MRGVGRLVLEEGDDPRRAKTSKSKPSPLKELAGACLVPRAEFLQDFEDVLKVMHERVEGKGVFW